MMKKMDSQVLRAKHPSSSVSHHGLIKLLVLHYLERKGQRWNEVAIVLEEGSATEVLAQ